MKGLIEGRIIHYVLPDGPCKGEHRPAIVVKLHSTMYGVANLLVFMDGMNDYAYGDPRRENPPLLRWATSILYSEAKLPGTYHQIEYSDAQVSTPPLAEGETPEQFLESWLGHEGIVFEPKFHSVVDYDAPLTQFDIDRIASLIEQYGENPTDWP